MPVTGKVGRSAFDTSGVGVPQGPYVRRLFALSRLSVLIKENVLEKLDHKNLNLDVDFLAGQFCSTENLVVAIWKQLKNELPEGVRLHGIKLYETPRIFVEYFGEDF